MIKNILLVGLGGFTGSILRYLIYLFVDRNFASPIMGTFTVNIIGSLILGIIVGLSTKLAISTEVRLLLAVGFCGSFTTFSTFAMENLQLLQDKSWIYPAGYITLSVGLGLVAALAGYTIGKAM